MTRQYAPRSVLVLLLVAFWGSPVSTIAAQTSAVALTGDGSTFAYPMYDKWIAEYKKENPGVHITYISNGSGAGIRDIIKGTVDFAGTDGPLTETQMLDFSTHRNCEALHFPTALGADVPIYNLPGYNAPGIAGYLNFTPETLAGIYLGTITKWNDPEISKANTQVSLPDHQIVVVHRQDGSGTTYIWTDYLSKVSSDWRQRVGTNISVAWPVGIAAEGNEGVAKAVVNTPYSIGYSELTYAVRSRLMYGSVANSSGRFVRADFASVTAAAASAAGGIPADFRVSITDPPGADVYPISSFTWILLPSVISDQVKSAALVKFVEWGLANGQDYLESLAYARLPQELIVREQTGLGRINTSNQANAGDSPSVSVRASQ